MKHGLCGPPGGSVVCVVGRVKLAPWFAFMVVSVRVHSTASIRRYYYFLRVLFYDQLVDVEIVCNTVSGREKNGDSPSLTLAGFTFIH